MNDIIVTKMHKTIMQASRVLIVPHKNPDGDALGSVTAMMQWLSRINKMHVTYCATATPHQLDFLPHIQKITNDANILDESFDIIIMLDSSNISYAGMTEYLNARKDNPIIINVDHHATNPKYGTINMVYEKAASTTEVLYHFFTKNKVHIDKNIATSLLTGLITDTDNFTNGATNTNALTIASDLIDKGGNLNMIKHAVYQDKSFNTLKLWGTVLSRLQRHDTLDIIYTYLRREDFQKHDVDPEEAEGLANFLNNIKEGKARLILKEKEDNIVKGSFRTTRDDIHVGNMAKALGGGGHQKAAGFSVEGPLEKAIDHIFSTLQNLQENVITT